MIQYLPWVLIERLNKDEISREMVVTYFSVGLNLFCHDLSDRLGKGHQEKDFSGLLSDEHLNGTPP